jgi:methionyl aminopeptidase
MRRAGRVVASMLALLSETARPGIMTKELDILARRELKRLGAKPSFLGQPGFTPFPATICTSLNHEIVHGIPGNYVLREGDLLKVDAGAIVNGFHADAAVTIPIGQISLEAQALLGATREALAIGIRAARGGERIGDIGAAIQDFVETRGYGLVREYVGHGIGRSLHEDPPVPNYGVSGRGVLLRPGMAIAIEPMLNLGTRYTKVLEDKWTVVTADSKLSSHFEHTLLITDGEAEVLTGS